MKRSARPAFILSALIMVCLAILFSGCGLKLSEHDDPEKEKKKDPCRKELESLQEDIKLIESAEGLEANIRKLVSIFNSMDGSCEAGDELFGYTLKRGRKNLPFLVAAGYALYRGHLLRVTENEQLWALEIWKDELRKSMMFEAKRMRLRNRLGKVSNERYRNYVEPMVEFATWNLGTLWRNRSVAEFPNVDPAEILVEDLEYLTHSISTMLTYYSLFSGHEILGNHRNFEMMRLHLNRLLKDPAERCTALESLAGSGLSVLHLGSPLNIQTGVNMSVPEHLQSPTARPSFVRNKVTGDALKSLLIQVPKPPDDPYRVWPAGFSYILKPIAGKYSYSTFLKARVKNDRLETMTERERVLQLLGKLEIKPFDEVRLELRNPRRYSLAGYIATNWLEEAEEACSVTMPRVQSLP